MRQWPHEKKHDAGGIGRPDGLMVRQPNGATAEWCDSRMVRQPNGATGVSAEEMGLIALVTVSTAAAPTSVTDS